MDVSRDDLIRAMRAALEGSPSIHAMWLEGADAHGLEDEYSDLDVWLDVEEGHAEEILAAIRTALTAIGPLDYDFEPTHPHPQIRQVFLHIEGTPESLVLDVCIQDHSREPAFRHGFVDEKVKALFDKTGVIRYRDVDWEAFRQQLADRTAELVGMFPLAALRVRKEIRRRNFLEALDYYRALLGMLVEVLRIRYEPTKHDFGLKHVRRDLPPEVVARLEHLYAVSSLEDIETRLPQAEQMLAEACDVDMPVDMDTP